MSELQKAITDAKKHPEAHRVAVEHRFCLACRNSYDRPEWVLQIICMDCHRPNKRNFHDLLETRP